ncbi:hypothetical protein MCNS_39810 [Mycobacterium conspicuum]|uniref:Uncharacterized protein n=1 Tax=Mycobacterium conspicuum TaxID=44010 RepID=A0A7I7YGJ6_9MYCO|nr:hypothetical protein MCNS_39810 [Mycobacterium conspicuum]
MHLATQAGSASARPRDSNRKCPFRIAEPHLFRAGGEPERPKAMPLFRRGVVAIRPGSGNELRDNRPLVAIVGGPEERALCSPWGVADVPECGLRFERQAADD